MVLPQYGVTAGAGVCFPDLGDFLGIKSFFPFPCLLSRSAYHTLLPSSPPFLPPRVPCVCLPSSHGSVQEGGRDLGLKLEWAHSGPLVSLPCVSLKILMLALIVRLWARGLCGTHSLESPGSLGEVCISCILQRGRVHGSPSTRASPGTWERYALWEAAQQPSVARPSSLVILRPHECAVLCVLPEDAVRVSAPLWS